MTIILLAPTKFNNMIYDNLYSLLVLIANGVVIRTGKEYLEA